jgi:hypothetical protein
MICRSFSGPGSSRRPVATHFASHSLTGCWSAGMDWVARRTVVGRQTNERKAMTRIFKSLGMFVGALLALTALGASTATAHVPARFTTEQEVVTVRGVHDSGTPATVFVVEGQTVSCVIEEFHGTVKDATRSVTFTTITPIYTECTAFGFVGAKVTGFGHYGEAASETCDYKIRADRKADLECPAGREVTIDAGTCVTHVPTQTGLGTIEFTTGTRNVKHDLTLDINLSGITVNTTDGFACPLNGSTHLTNSTLVGKATAWAEDEETHAAVGITWEDTTA